MGKLVYAAIMSVDGYIEDASGAFDWAVPDDEVHAFINQLEGGIGTHLFGRRMYETMAAWETDAALAESSALAAEFASVWQAADKVVYSTTLAAEAVVTSRTRLERAFDADAVRELKASAETDLSVGGPGLAASAFAARLVDECHLFVVPILVGAGKPALPTDGPSPLALVDQRVFESGFAYLRYDVDQGPPRPV